MRYTFQGKQNGCIYLKYWSSWYVDWISIEFDPFGFDVKDFRMRIPIMRCNSTGDLYPLTPSSFNRVTTPSVFSAISQDLWHHRLGHPGASILRSLNNKQLIHCNKTPTSNICQSWIFGKHIRLPFVNSSTCTFMPFDIVHSDLWTSPIVSSNGHRYYVLFLWFFWGLVSGNIQSRQRVDWAWAIGGR